jgi:hypothetical protein
MAYLGIGVAMLVAVSAVKSDLPNVDQEDLHVSIKLPTVMQT